VENFVERAYCLTRLIAASALATVLTAAQPSVFSLPQQPSTKSGKAPAQQESKRGEGAISPPKLIYSPDPHYTVDARRAHVEGSVVLTLMVGTYGLPREIKVIRHLGYGLDEEAIKAVRTWRFEPAKKNGKPVPIRIDALEIEFRLH
jgi:TonB family protein